MATIKRWPIGLQSGTTGDPRGIGEVIRDLSRPENKIAFFSASSHSTSILGDLQHWARESGVPHTGNFMVEDNTPGELLKTPRYGRKPSRQLAIEHWDLVESRVPIKNLQPNPPGQPIDWTVPCLWLSTWNEVRGYTKWWRDQDEKDGQPQIAPEDPVAGFTGNADLIGWQAVEIGKEAVRRGYRWAAFGFSGGNPEEDFWDQPGTQAYLKLCAEHPESLGVALHEYSLALTLDVPAHIGRFQLLHAACDRLGIRRPVIQIKEFGWRDIRIPDDPTKAMNQLHKVAQMYMQHPNIHGAAIWTLQEWPGRDPDQPAAIYDQVRALIPRLHAAALAHAQPIPEKQPSPQVVAQPAPVPSPQPIPDPVVPPVVLQTAGTSQFSGAWPFTILQASAAEAKQRHKVQTKEFGIDVSHYQQDRLNWKQLKRDDVRFAYIRVGSGRMVQDPNYLRNVSGCVRNDIPFGNYFFLYEDIDMQQQARMFVHQADWRSTLPPVVDIERRGLKANQIKAFIDEFHRLVESPPIVIYTSVGAWNWIVPKRQTWPAKHPLWVANWGQDTPALPHHWDRWLFFQPGTKDGLPGYPKRFEGDSDRLDYNHFNGTIDELTALEAQVCVRAVTFEDYIPFDSPVGNPEQRRRKEKMYPGNWIDANPFRNHYTNPKSGLKSYHTGSDLNMHGDADRNEPIYAAADGKVTFAGHLDIWGNVIIIEHGPMLYSRYGHVTNMRVQVGQMVERGKHIANVGQDALGGPFHLHFDISQTDILKSKPWHWPGNNLELLDRHYVDPKDYIERHRPQRTQPAATPRLRKPERFGFVNAPAQLALRSIPSTENNDPLRYLPHRTKVGIYSLNNGWYHVRVGNQEGFVFAAYVVETVAETESPEVVPSGVYKYQGPAVDFFTGIHGPADDFMWNDNGLKTMMNKLDLPVFFMSSGINVDNRRFGEPSKNAVRIVWNPSHVTPEKAYQEIRDEQLINWWEAGYRRFSFFNEPQIGPPWPPGVSPFPRAAWEGQGVAWDGKDEFADFLAVVLRLAKKEFAGIELFTTPMTTNKVFDPWGWRESMWQRVRGLVSGWCMHAYSGTTDNADVAAQTIANEIIALQRHFRLQIPIIVSEAAVNKGNNPTYKAQVAHLVHKKLAKVSGVHGLFWYVADWHPDRDKNHEGWLRNGIWKAYLEQNA